MTANTIIKLQQDLIQALVKYVEDPALVRNEAAPKPASVIREPYWDYQQAAQQLTNIEAKVTELTAATKTTDAEARVIELMNRVRALQSEVAKNAEAAKELEAIKGKVDAWNDPVIKELYKAIINPKRVFNDLTITIHNEGSQVNRTYTWKAN